MNLKRKGEKKERKRNKTLTLSLTFIIFYFIFICMFFYKKKLIYFSSHKISFFKKIIMGKIKIKIELHKISGKKKSFFKSIMQLEILFFLT